MMSSQGRLDIAARGPLVLLTLAFAVSLGGSGCSAEIGDDEADSRGDMSLAISGGETLRLEAGERVQLYAAIQSATGSTVDLALFTLSWSSSDGGTASVEPNGVITGKRGGTAVVTASAERVADGMVLTATINVVVSDPATPSCGDGSCGDGETSASCPADCQAPEPVCGDGSCGGGETSTSCPADCAAPGPVCGDGSCDSGETSTSCPADCAAPVGCSPGPQPHPYFDLLTGRSECLHAFHFRSQANIDSLPSRADSLTKIPITYDAVPVAAKFEIDPSGSLPHSGSTGTPQKRMPVAIQGATSMLLTWDLKISESMRYRGSGYLAQHKSHRLDTRDASPWIGIKQNYAKGANTGLGIAHLFFTAAQTAMGPGTTRGSSETILPVLGEYYIQPDTWTRVWVFVEGNIGTGDNLVQMSVWVADENRQPFQLYDRVNMITPVEGIGLFRFEFDSSQKEALNGPGRQWQRNYVVLRGLSRAQVVSLLQKP